MYVNAANCYERNTLCYKIANYLLCYDAIPRLFAQHTTELALFVDR